MDLLPIPADMTALLDALCQYGKPYLVGGCIRDMFLEKKPKDYDVVIDTPDTRFSDHLNIKPIGDSFLVYLTKTKAGRAVEIALPRKEKKVSLGHCGFDIEKASSIEEDLIRRDFTVNAMAYDWKEKRFIFGHPDCLDHLKKKVLKHTSSAFVEDPLRVFRGARFLASFKDFVLHPETLQLFQSMKPELETLSADRIRVEMEKALDGKYPEKFFQTLAQANCLDYWFPEVNDLIGVDHRHEEGDVFTHTMMVLEKLRGILTQNRDVLRVELMLCALSHDFGKPHVPTEIRPKMYGHEDLAAKPISKFCKRLKLGGYERSMQIVAKYHMAGHRASQARPGTLYKLLGQVDRTRVKFQGFLDVCHADAVGRIITGKDLENEWAIEHSILRTAYFAVPTATWPEGAHWQQIQDAKIKAIKSAVNFSKKSLGIREE